MSSISFDELIGQDFIKVTDKIDNRPSEIVKSLVKKIDEDIVEDDDPKPPVIAKHSISMKKQLTIAVETEEAEDEEDEQPININELEQEANEELDKVLDTSVKS